MINHHPDDNMLVEYASGSLPWALSISVSAHMQLCPQCRAKHQQLSILGGAYLDEAPSENVEEDSFSRLMSRIASNQGTHQASPVKIPQSKDVQATQLPKVIQKLLPDNLQWRKVSSALKMARLTTGQEQYEVAFHKISKGGKVVEHDHKGLEVTLVLEGSFSDEGGVYQRGDFIVRDPGQTHRPTATLDQDCLCLSVCEAPVAVKGWLGKVVNPFLSIRPA